MGIKEKLLAIQTELKAPKNQRNDFGKFNYRSCEDILEAVKPLLKKHKAALTISDDIVQIGDRYYVKAVARLSDIEDGESIENPAFARESDTKKGMDESQVTGATSSYARKYALNGLFLIDDNKDADTNEFQGAVKGQSAEETKQNNEWTSRGGDPIDSKKIASLKSVCKKHNLPESVLAGKYRHKTLEEISIADYLEFVKSGEAFLKDWDENHAG